VRSPMRATEQCPAADHWPLARFPRTITTRERDRPTEPYSPSIPRSFETVTSTSHQPLDPPLDRRDLLKLGAFLAPAERFAPLLAACSTPSPSQAATVRPTSAAARRPFPAPITALVEGGDPTTEPALRKVFDDFKAQNPAIAWDIRGIPGLGPDWDRIAVRPVVGEPVGLVILDGLFRSSVGRVTGCWPTWAAIQARRRSCPGAGQVPSRRPSGNRTRAFPLALSRGVQTTGSTTTRPYSIERVSRLRKRSPT